MTTITTLLSGGEGVGLGARAADLTHLEGFELDDAIASVARLNGFNVHTANLFDVDPATLTVPDVLHASPVCTNASIANQSAELNEEGTKESKLDIAMGEKVAQFIDVMTPKIVTLENVYQYRHFKAFKLICAALDRNGYFWDYDNLNSADYGVPQTRRRLILRAMRGSLLPMLPQPERWVGWYEAIEDLIPTLPESKFAPWQLARLPEEMKTCMLPGGNMWTPPVNSESRAFTVQTSGHSLQSRAFILDCQNGGDTNGERGVTLPQGDAPMFTVTSGKQGKQPVRAFLVDGDGNRSRPPTVIDQLEPAITVQAWHGRRPIQSPRAWLSQGRVVKMTPRALARFQSFPDSYKMPELQGIAREILEAICATAPAHLKQFIYEQHITDNRLACKIIGNSVPPLLYRKIIAPLVECIR
jgi:DNA (cytosine-5)-methyltransferase 1